VGPRAGLDGKAENFHLHRDSISGPSSPWRVAIPTELSGHTLFFSCINYKIVILKARGFLWSSGICNETCNFLGRVGGGVV
jgi:hypothetical protein